MGSRRLLYEMALDSKFVRGLKLELIDQVAAGGRMHTNRGVPAEADHILHGP